MRIVLTGASSFTGYWFAKALAAGGHELVMPLLRVREQYRGVRRRRVDGLEQCGEVVFDCEFGSRRFIDALTRLSGFDALCHHAAQVADYRSRDFDVIGAVEQNTKNLQSVLETMGDRGARRLFITGSVFEPAEGAGSDRTRAVSPYGLSKAFTAELVAYYADVWGIEMGKFVVANPFGPLEELRFVSYLVHSWLSGETAVVRTPDYVRDNIHVSLLALAYARFVSEPGDAPGLLRLNPSGYVESQGAFASRCARCMHGRLGVDCRLSLTPQTEFPEPRIRINTDPVDATVLGWDEAGAWDELAEYYRDVASSA